MKKTRFPILILTALLTAAMGSCGSDESVELAELEGWQSFIILRPDEADPGEVTAAVDLRKALEALGCEMQLATDWVKRGESPPTGTSEILIGGTNRPESSAYELLANDFVIAYEGGRVVINGGSDEAVLGALEWFKENCIDAEKGGLLVPVEPYVYRAEYTLLDTVIGGVPLREYALSYDTTNSQFAEAAEEVGKILRDSTGVAPEVNPTEGGAAIVLAFDDGLGLFEAGITLDGNTLTLAVDGDGIGFDAAAEQLVAYLNEQNGGEISLTQERIMVDMAKIENATEMVDRDTFYEQATDDIIEKYMNEADALIREIVNYQTSAEVTGKKYYVSADGDDANDGLTPETAWKTVEKVNSFTGYKSGDGVYFRRGDSWRITTPLSAKSGVTYSAFGDGAKPKLIASVDASDADMWEATDCENVYKLKLTLDVYKNNVGTIVFDGGDAWGIQVQQKKDGTRLDNGTVYNGIESYTIPTGTFDGYSDLQGNLEFYHDRETSQLYLYCEGGNPGDVFGSIEVVDKGHGISLAKDSSVGVAHDIVIDNIEIFGAGSHGIGGGGVKDVTVQYCVLTWIGGSVQSYDVFGRDYGTRYGNAVESYGSSENFTIRYNYASQIYDCCWTVQQQEATTMTNIQMYKNVSEFCNTGLEVWQGGGTITNMQLHDNYTRFNGYGWSHQRPNKDGNFFYGATNTNCTYIDNDVYNNVGMFASRYVLFCGATGTEQYNFHDNLYIMEDDKHVGGVTATPGAGSGGIVLIPYKKVNLSSATAGGFELGTEFYYTSPSPWENMYDLYDNTKSVYSGE
ncbi:MAG: hypothetical protein IJ493_11990 [Clostridia bacterium]|nr:hypothetical protein [Clostridia bacterium]